MDDPFLERLRQALEPEFDVERVLGAGGMGIVVLARERSLGRRVAIKTIRPEYATAVAVERFLREAQTLASLSHPNIVPIYSLQERDGIPCIVMEFLEGETLRGRISRGPMPVDEVRRVGRDLLSALDAAHGRGIVHRDVKPDNIFLRPDRAVLTDFGIAKPVAARGESLTVPGQAVGTPAYMAPERFATGDSQPTSDVYAVGMVLYEALTGRMWNQEIVDPAAGDWTGVPRDLAPVLQRALEFSPSARWTDAASFRHALKARRPRAWMAWTAAVAASAVALVLWPKPRPPTIADVALGQFRPADPGGRLRDVAFDVLRNAEGLTLVLLHDDAGEAEAAGPRATREVTAVVERVDGRLRVALQVGGQRVEVLGESGEFEWDLGRRIALAILEVADPDAFRALAPGCKPRSVEAYNAWSKGQEAFRRDDWGSAIRLFEEAVVRDPDYCLAEVRLWLVQRWSRTPITVDLGRLLARHGGSLAKPDSLMIAAELAPTRERRWALYEEAVARDPFGAVAPLQYGSDLFHRGPLDGIPLDSGVTLLRKAREREPLLASTHDQLMWALIRLGQRDSARAALDALVANSRDSVRRDVDPAVFQLLWALRFLPLDSARALLGGAGPGAEAQLAERLRVGLSFDLAPFQGIIGRALAARTDAAVGMRAHGQIATSLALLASGAPAAGMAMLDTAVTLSAGWSELALQAAQWRVLAGVLGIPVPPNGAAGARGVLERLAADSVLGGRALWTLALDAWQRNEAVAARAFTARIPARDSALRTILMGIETGVRSARRALDQTDELRGVREEKNQLGDAFARAILHLRRAGWYEELGDRGAAARELRWHENSDFEGWLTGAIQAAEVDWVAGAYVRVREGMRRVQAGDLAACADLRRVVDAVWVEVESDVAVLRGAGREVAARCR